MGFFTANPASASHAFNIAWNWTDACKYCILVTGLIGIFLNTTSLSNVSISSNFSINLHLVSISTLNPSPSFSLTLLINPSLNQLMLQSFQSHV